MTGRPKIPRRAAAVLPMPLNRAFRRISILASAAAIASNAGLPYAADAWREGWVFEIVAGAQLDHVQDRPCLAHLGPDEIAHRQFVVVTYPRGRARGYRTLPMPDGSDLKRGDRVWFEAGKCDSPSKSKPESTQ